VEPTSSRATKYPAKIELNVRSIRINQTTGAVTEYGRRFIEARKQINRDYLEQDLGTLWFNPWYWSSTFGQADYHSRFPVVHLDVDNDPHLDANGDAYYWGDQPFTGADGATPPYNVLAQAVEMRLVGYFRDDPNTP
jgi:hypothetical protein